MVEVQQIDPGDYLVFVDSNDHGGDFQLSVERVSPANDLRVGSSLVGNCTAPDEFMSVSCCGLVSTVEAEREVISCANPHPDVFQSVPLDPGCGVTGAFTAISETPHQIEMLLVGTCTGSGVCGPPATLVNGLYTSSVSFTGESTGGACSVVARVTSLDPFADRGPVLVRYVQDGQPFCN
jgi:hypothetical protein